MDEAKRKKMMAPPATLDELLPPEVEVKSKNAQLLLTLYQAQVAAQEKFDLVHLAVCNDLDVDPQLYQRVGFKQGGGVVLQRVEPPTPLPVPVPAPEGGEGPETPENGATEPA